MPHRPAEVIDMAHLGEAELQSFLRPWADIAQRWSRPSRSLRLTRLQLNVLASLALFGMLSWYFFMPSTLYLYLVFVCFTCPVFLLYCYRWPSGHAMPSRYALFSIMVVLYVALCVVRGWAPTPTVPAEWRQPSGHTYYIASLLYNSERILPHYSDTLLRLTDELGHDAVFISIFENNSKDRTPMLLQNLGIKLRERGVRFNITTTMLSDDIRESERIARLSYMRNRAMAPLYDEVRDGLYGRPFSRVIWINDILFEPDAVHTLLHTANGQFDQVCGLDYFWLGFYDTWVLRDTQGNTVRPLFPYFRTKEDRDDVQAQRPFPVNACWNGLTVFDARWFTNGPRTPVSANGTDGPVIATLPPPPLEHNDGYDTAATLPLQFRPCAQCFASESLLTSLDMHRLAHPKRPRIYVHPGVKVMYDYPSYYLYQHVLRWYVVQPWSYIWETWIERRLFSWIANLGLRPDPCGPLFQQMWSREPAPRLTPAAAPYAVRPRPM